MTTDTVQDQIKEVEQQLADATTEYEWEEAFALLKRLKRGTHNEDEQSLDDIRRSGF